MVLEASLNLYRSPIYHANLGRIGDLAYGWKKLFSTWKADPGTHLHRNLINCSLAEGFPLHQFW